MPLAPRKPRELMKRTNLKLTLHNPFAFLGVPGNASKDPLKGLIRPLEEPYKSPKGLIRPLEGLLRHLKAL